MTTLAKCNNLLKPELLAANFTQKFFRLFILGQFERDEVFKAELMRQRSVAIPGIGTHHLWFLLGCRSCPFGRRGCFQFFVGVLRHPETCLDPLLLGDLAHHTVVFVLHLSNRLHICLLVGVELLQTLVGLGGARHGDSHFYFVELFDLPDDLILLLLCL